MVKFEYADLTKPLSEASDSEVNAYYADKAAYDGMRARIETVESATGAYLQDENVDMQNTIDGGVTLGMVGFWRKMLDSQALGLVDNCAENRLYVEGIGGARGANAIHLSL
jgi:hypothetical protein